MSIDLLFHHGYHIECVPHGVEAQNSREFFETGPVIDQLHLFIYCLVQTFSEFKSSCIRMYKRKKTIYINIRTQRARATNDKNV